LSIIYAKVLLFDGPCKRSRSANSPGTKLSLPFNGFARYEALAVGSSRGFAPVREEKSAGRLVIRVSGVAQPVAEKVECKDGNNHVDDWKH
jgi:hypothetical protein